jgi:hypothetical protein
MEMSDSGFSFVCMIWKDIDSLTVQLHKMFHCGHYVFGNDWGFSTVHNRKVGLLFDEDWF